MKNSLILDKVRYVEVKSSSPSLPYIPLSFNSLSANLPSILFLYFPCHPLSYLLLLPLLLLFPVPSVVPYIPHSLSIFSFLSQPSPSLLFLFPTYLLPYLSTSLASPSIPFPLPHYSLFSTDTFPLFLYFFLFLSFSLSLFPPFFFPLFFFLFLPLFLPLPFPCSWVFDFFPPPRGGGKWNFIHP